MLSDSLLLLKSWQVFNIVQMPVGLPIGYINVDDAGL